VDRIERSSDRFDDIGAFCRGIRVVLGLVAIAMPTYSTNSFGNLGAFGKCGRTFAHPKTIGNPAERNSVRKFSSCLKKI